MNLRTVVQQKVIDLVQPDFDFDLTDRVMVVSDLDHFSDDDPFVWGQKQDKVPEFFEVYWDDVYLMDFNEGDTPEMVYVQFLKSFGEAYEAGKISLNKFLSEHEQDIDTMIKKDKVEKLKKNLTGAFEVGEDKATGAEKRLAQKVIKEMEES